MEAVVFKIRHKPTGLFYQAVKGRWSKNKSNLGIRGKIYETKQYPKDLHKSFINVSESLTKKFNLIVEESRSGFELITSENDWEVVPFTLKEY